MRGKVSWLVAVLVVLFLGALPYWDLSRKYEVLHEQTVKLRELSTEHDRQVRETELLSGLLRTNHRRQVTLSDLQRTCVACHADMAMRDLMKQRDADEVLGKLPSVLDVPGPFPRQAPKGTLPTEDEVEVIHVAPMPREVSFPRGFRSHYNPNYGLSYDPISSYPFALPPVFAR